MRRAIGLAAMGAHVLVLPGQHRHGRHPGLAPRGPPRAHRGRSRRGPGCRREAPPSTALSSNSGARRGRHSATVCAIQTSDRPAAAKRSWVRQMVSFWRSSRGSPPISSTDARRAARRAVGQHRGLDVRPVRTGDVEDAPGVEQVPGGRPVDQGHQLAASHFMQVQDRDAGRADTTQGDGLHPGGAEQRLSGHVVDVDLQRGPAAQGSR